MATCNKQRFALRTDAQGALFIRANQGHTFAIDEEKLLSPIAVPPPFVIHGTYNAPLAAIRAQGLSRMKRTHIHMAAGFDVVSGIRSNCTVAIVVDVRRAMADGIKFFVSDNGVVLTSGNADGFLEPRYFAAILDAKTRRPLGDAAAPAFDVEAHKATQQVDSAGDDNDTDDVDTADAERSKKSKKGSL